MQSTPAAPLRRAGILWTVAALLAAVGAILDRNVWLGLGAIAFAIIAWMTLRAPVGVETRTASTVDDVFH